MTRTHTPEHGVHVERSKETKEGVRDLHDLHDEVMTDDGHHDDHNEHHDHDDHGHGASVKERTVKTLLEQARRENVPDEVLRRMENDLRKNKTADYSRMNLAEVFMAFDFEVHHTVTHWRVSKIMDALTIASDEYNIVIGDENGKGFNFKAADQQIYKALEENRGDDKTWTVEVRHPQTGQSQKEKASLADFVHLIDTLELNRQLGPDRFDKRQVVYNFFTGEAPLEKIIIDKEGKEKKVNLLADEVNPRDNFKDVDIKGYKEWIDRSEDGMLLIDSWRHTSQGHREIAGHAFKIEVDGKLIWIPVSGEVAQKITFEDMQKSSDAKVGLSGQPQEIGDMDEAETGAIIRFRSRFLRQRKVGIPPGNIANATTVRMAKAMMGLTLSEDAVPVREKGAKKEKVIYIGNKDLSAKVIKGMGAHYNAARRDILGSRELGEREAADLLFTDVIAPCILNGDGRDWLIALSKAYGVSSAQGIVSSSTFQDFTLKIMCRRYDGGYKGQIDWKEFNSMDELRDYVYDRVQRGHVEQDGNVNIQELREQAEQEKKKRREFDKNKGKNAAALITELLGTDYRTYLADFIEGKNEFSPIRIGKDRLPGGHVHDEGAPKVSFINILEREFEFADRGRIAPLLKKVYPDLDEDDLQENEGYYNEFVNIFLEAISAISETGFEDQRKKLKI